jgi:putative (di)nucleoside polyphosphate hydrolase
MNTLFQLIGSNVIDSEGFRPNVGIILCNEEGRLFWAKRIGQRSWQFPQGGIQRDESPEQAMFRELAEEVGLRPEHVQVIGCTKGWLRYRLPKRLIRQGNKPACIGQKQVWFLLRMLGDEESVRLDLSERPEFDHWQWVDYWYPLRAVVWFKRQVYWRALRELAPLLFAGYQPQMPSARDNAETGLHPLDLDGGLGPRKQPILSAPMRYSASAVSAATVIRASGSVRVANSAKHPVVVPLRRVETCKHPVITRMVVSARRFGVLDPIPAGPALEQSGPIGSPEESRTPRSTASNPRHWSRR